MADLEQVAQAMGLSTYIAYGAVLCGEPTPNQKELYERLRDIRVGDWVVEQTTILMCGGNRERGHYRNALDAVGILLKITQEKVVFSDPDFAWDEATEGRPHPTETCTYIRTLDGREFRWTNASFLSIPSEWPVRHG